MPRKTHSPEEIVGILRDVEIKQGQGRHDAYTAMEYAFKGRFYVGPKMNNTEAVAKRRAELEETLCRHGVADWYIDSMRKIRYLFPKAHDASYSLLRFRLAWYKAHYPLEFYVAMLNEIDEEGVFEPDDFLKETMDLKAEIKRLTDDGRSWALKLICDAREHGMKFVPYNSRENSALERRFSAGADRSIFVFEAVMDN